MSKFNVFDVLGPIMIGPSSSHTAGASRLGKIVKGFLQDEEIYDIIFYLHGSFGHTYKGHGTDKALVGGILGFETYDKRIRTSFDIAKQNGLKFKFIPIDLGDKFHPNTVKFVINTKSGLTYEIIGSSIGGGKIELLYFNGLNIKFNGNSDAVVVMYDYNISDNIIRLFNDNNIDIFNISYSDNILYAEFNKNIDTDLLYFLKNIDGILKIILLKSI